MNRECLADYAPVKQTFEEMVRGLDAENYGNSTKQTEQEVQRSKDGNMPSLYHLRHFEWLFSY